MGFVYLCLRCFAVLFCACRLLCLVLSSFGREIQKKNSKRKLPIGDTMAEEAKVKVKHMTL